MYHYLKSMPTVGHRHALKKITILVGAACVSGGVIAGNSWLSKSVVIDEKQQTRSYYSTNKAAKKAITSSSQTLFDITISLYNAPAGDDDASTANGDAQEVHEEIIGYFADAVCEQSNGAHKLRKVSVFKNRKHQAKADIVWNEREWPRAHLAGFGANGMHIYFGDIFPGSTDKDMLADTKGAGYTLGHEWGHYTYGVLDEYKGKKGTTAGARSPQNTDVPPSPSIMNNQWNAKSSGESWLNHSTSNNFGDAARTAQGRVYGKSAWDVLVQDPKDDPKSGQKTAQPSRTQYLALDAAQPDANDNWIVEQLPALQADCRNELNIVWVEGDIDMQLVIDRSGSMRGSAISNARQAAKLLVDATAEGTTSLGVVSFSGFARQDSVVQPIPSPGATVKAEIKQSIDSISASGSTALYDGAQLALQNLVDYQSNAGTGAPGVVFVLADGDDNSSFYNQATVITNYQNANIPIFSFGYGSASPTGPLLDLANGTGGKYFSSPTTLSEITDAFLQANALATDSQNLADSSIDIQASSNADYDLLVDTGIGNISLFFNHSGGVDDVTYAIFDANNAAVPASFNCLSLSGGTSCSANIDSDTINAAATGSWVIAAKNVSVSTREVSFNASGEPSDSGTYNVTVEGSSGNSVVYPEPMILTTAIIKDRSITGVNVTASIVDPLSAETEFLMVDDGTNGDGVADDGIYSAIVGYQTNGLHQVTVYVNNNDGNAIFTDVGLLTPAEDGTEPEAPVLPAIQENFYRVSKASIVVSDVPFSDGDDSTSSANTLVPDNTGFDSQINNAGDVDFYRADNVDVSQSLFVRVTDFSLGMLPKISIIKEDGSTEVVTDATLNDSASATGYLFKEVVTADLTSTMYISVEHEDGTATQGGYQISVGPQINTDVPPNAVPVANEDVLEVFAGFDVSAAVLANDTDSDNDTLNVESVDSNGALGTLTLQSDNTIMFTTGGAYSALSPGQTLVEQMFYVVSDSKGGFAQGTITLTVKANSLPNAVEDTVEVNENGSVTIIPLANDTDADNHTLTLISINSSELNGSLIDNNDGSFTYDPAGAFNLLAETQTDVDTFTYVVADELGGESSGTVTITVNGLNQLPVANPDTARVSESSSVSIDVIANDTDPDMDTLAIESVDSTGLKGSVTIDSDSTVTYSPNGAFDNLNSGETQTDEFTYILSDGTATVSTTVTVTVTGVDAPKTKSGGGLFWLLPLGLLFVCRRLATKA